VGQRGRLHSVCCRRSIGISVCRSPIRMRAATIAIQYGSPRLAVTGVLRDDAGFVAALERAIGRSGKRDEMKVIGHRDDGTN
jgi:hypothetical protein